MAVAERKNQTLNNQLASFMKSDSSFMEGIKKGAKACKEGRVRPWIDIKRELDI